MKIDKQKDHIIYNDEFHLYINSITKQKYESMTTFLGRIDPPFDPMMAYYCAQRDVRNGWTTLSVEDRERELKAKWAAKNKLVCDLGTRLHYVLEMMLTHGYSRAKVQELYKLTEEEMIYIDYVKELNLDAEGTHLILEDLLYHDFYMKAGQSDVVRIIGDYVHIDDWKFNFKEELTWEGFRGATFMFPLDYMQASKLNTYELQLSGYMYFKCLETGLKPGTLQIHHFYKGKCRTHKFQYREKEIKLLLDYFHYRGEIPIYGNVDLFEGRMGISKKGKIIRVHEVLEDKVLLQIGSRIDYASIDKARKFLSLPPC